MERLTLASLNIPECYIVNKDDDINLCRKRGLPYVIWYKSKEELQKAAMLSQMKQQFPGVNWEQEYGISEDDIPNINMPGNSEDGKEGEGLASSHKSTATDGKEGEGLASSHKSTATEGHSENDLEYNAPMGVYSMNHRDFKEHIKNGDEENCMKLNEFIDDANVKVNTDVLLKLKLLPKFLSNIVQSIQVDKTKSKWQMGYDKKRKLCIGNLKPKTVLRNLIILDVSGSIPRGIADTMITLLHTLKDELKADVIVTSTTSKGWTFEEDVPDAQWIRRHFGCGNESYEFCKLLSTKFNGAVFNNVYSFGDDDCPNSDNRFIEKIHYWSKVDECKWAIPNIKVNNVYHFPTGIYNDDRTGFAMWCHELNPNVKEYYDTSWCENMYTDDEY